MRSVTKLERLREVALDQHGFITTAQAIEEDVSLAELSTMVARGRIESGVPSYLIRQALERAGRTSQLPAAERARLAAELQDRDAAA